MTNIKEDDLKARSPLLLEKLRERLDNLKEGKVFVEEIMKLISEVELEVGKQNYQAALGKYTDALERIEKAEVSLQANSLAWKLLRVEFGYLFLLLILLGFGYITYKIDKFFYLRDLINLNSQTVWFGALGGVTIAIYGIFSHIQLRDFDPKFKLWYICKPIIGGIFGWFVYLIYALGFVWVQNQSVENMKTPQVAYLIAFLAGFSERFTIKMIDKLMAVLTTFQEAPSEDKSKTVLPKV